MLTLIRSFHDGWVPTVLEGGLTVLVLAADAFAVALGADLAARDEDPTAIVEIM